MKFRSVYYLGTSVALVCLLAACAPAPPHLDASVIELDPDLHKLPTPASAEYVELAFPDPRPGFDCNGNNIDDAFDIAGIIPRGPYQVGDNPYYLTAGDLDGDGDTDIAVSNYGDGTVTILWQRSNRRFDRSRTIPLNIPADQLPPHPTCIVASDIDKDGDNDLLVAPDGGGMYPFVILMRNNRGQFDLEQLQMPASAGYTPTPKCVTVTDINNDGHPDILATSGLQGDGPPARTQQVTLFRNLGDGNFASPERFTPNPNWNNDDVITDIRDLTSADLDRDGYPEVIFKGDWTVGILKNETVSGNPFADWVSYYRNWRTSELAAIAAADIELDYGENLVVLQANGIVNVLRNTNGSLSGGDLLGYAVGSGGRGIGTGDIDNDGDIDIVVPEPSTNSVALLRNNIRQNLLRPMHLPVSDAPTGIYVGNLDSDSRLEIAVSNTGTDDVWVLHVRPEPVSVDCNNNGRPDSCDVQDPGIDEDGDGVPDSCIGGDRPQPSPPM